MSTIAYPHISIDSAVCDGAPCIAGHRIRVVDIAVEHERGKSPTEIRDTFAARLSLADVYAALTYFYDHPDLIQKHREADDAAIAEYRRNPEDRTS
jgi:uncharacterized protein (DUF433 family)